MFNLQNIWESTVIINLRPSRRQKELAGTEVKKYKSAGYIKVTKEPLNKSPCYKFKTEGMLRFVRDHMVLLSLRGHPIYSEVDCGLHWELAVEFSAWFRINVLDAAADSPHGMGFLRVP